MCELMYEGMHYDTTAHPGRVPSLLGHCYNPSLGKSVIFFTMAIPPKGVLSGW